MANIRLHYPLWLLFTFILGAYVTQGSRTYVPVVSPNTPFYQYAYLSKGDAHLKGRREAAQSYKNIARRLMIGSTAPTCTYNECRGCKYKCRAEQVPVEGNDPINSPYRYRCVCQR